MRCGGEKYPCFGVDRGVSCGIDDVKNPNSLEWNEAGTLTFEGQRTACCWRVHYEGPGELVY